jgi:transcriptional regulator with XRE-family HTH domain
MIKEQVLKKLYLQDEMSMQEIAKKLNVSARQVDYWMRKYNVKARKISQAVYLKLNKSGDPFDIPELIKNKKFFRQIAFLYGLGLGLYWGEGNKKNKNTVRLGNSDPKLIKKFIEFLVKIFNIKKSKLRFGLQIFSDLDEQAILDYWSKELQFPKQMFYKTIITRTGKSGTYKHKSKYGVVTVHFGNTKLRNFLVEKIAEL